MAASEKRLSSVERHAHIVDNIDSINKGEKPTEHDEKRDWTGTTRKTDPEEIKLVRKLDYWIMVGGGNDAKCQSDSLTMSLQPTLCTMYFLSELYRP